MLRNWMAQRAIEAAEKDDFSEVHRVLRLLESPFSDDAAPELEVAGDGAAACKPAVLQYDGPIPSWAKGLCVSCSS